MTIFVVIPTSNRSALDDLFKRDEWLPRVHRLPRGEWLVSFDGTTQELSDNLGVSAPEGNGPAVIFAVSAYFGRAPTNIWEWLKSRWS